jgi:hypothetical protein
LATVSLEVDGVSNVHAATRALNNCERFDKDAERYLLALLRELTSCAVWEDVADVITALNRSLRRRGSGGLDQDAWASLNLPAQLFDLASGTALKRERPAYSN